MIKKYITPLNVVLLVALILALIPEEYAEYKKYLFYIVIAIAIPIGIINLIKLRKEDQLNGTNTFWPPIIRMLILGSVLVAFFFITKQSHI